MADENKATSFVLKDDPTFKQMVSVISALGAGLKEARTQNEALSAKIGELTDTLKDVKTNKSESMNQAGLSDEQLNEMPQAEFIKHVNKIISDNVSRATGDVRKDIAKVSDTFTQKSLQEEIKNFAKEHPDLLDFTEEIKSIIDETPGLSVQRAYALAKTENPDKATTVAEKYKTDADRPQRQPFGGLTPTSGASPAGEDGKPLTQDKAADKAWNDTLTKFPALSEVMSEQ